MFEHDAGFCSRSTLTHNHLAVQRRRVERRIRLSRDSRRCRQVEILDQSSVDELRGQRAAADARSAECRAAAAGEMRWPDPRPRASRVAQSTGGGRAGRPSEGSTARWSGAPGMSGTLNRMPSKPRPRVVATIWIGCRGRPSDVRRATICGCHVDITMLVWGQLQSALPRHHFRWGLV